MRFVYAVAFSGRRFVMVRSRERRSWEMPGGEVKEGETPEDAMEREFEEETGMGFEIISSRGFDGGTVFFGYAVGWPRKISPEIASVELFDRLPAHLSFPRKEYEAMLKEARSVLRSASPSRLRDGQ